MSGNRGPARPVFLVTGAGGQVGHELVRELAPLGTVHAPARDVLDLERVESIREVVRAVRPTMIVNAAAYTAVDRAESDVARCTAVNAIAPGILAEEAARLGAGIVHYSTDYVFDGAARRPYTEADEPAPLGVYGATKLAGEQAVMAAGGGWLIFRTSWVYGARGQNFLRTILRLAHEREELRVVDDQVGAPTWSRQVAAGTAQMLARAGTGAEALAPRAGIYNLAAAGQTTWCGFARAIVAGDPGRTAQRVRVVTGIATSEYPTPARRPAWSVLDGTRTEATLGLRLPDWETQLAMVFG